MVSPVHGDYRRLQAEIPLIVLCRFPGPALTDAGGAIQEALNNGPGTVFLPQGTYLIGRTLRIPSGISLILDEQARIVLAPGSAKEPHDYLLTNANHGTGNENISIEGGLWDGNSRDNPRPAGLFDYGYSGAIMHFANVKGLRLSDLHLHNAEAYYTRLTNVRSFHVEHIRFSSDRVRPNNDGIHLGGNCQDGVIRNIKGLHPGVTGDDMIALNADDALSRTEVKGMTCGPIRNILIEDVEAHACHSFVRLLSVFSPIENISIRNIRGTCEIAAINCDAARGCRVPLFDEEAPPFPDGVGMLKDITASDLRVAKSAQNVIALLRLETRMQNFRLLNFKRNLDADRSKATPTIRLRHLNARSLILTSPTSEKKTATAFGNMFETNEHDISSLIIN